MNNVKKKNSKKTINPQSPVAIFSVTVIGVVVMTCGIYFGVTRGHFNRIVQFVTRPLSSVQILDPITLIQSNDAYTIIDIRSKEEYAKSHIKKAVSIPVYRIDGAVMQLAELHNLIIPRDIDRTKPVVLYGPSAYFASTTKVATQLQKQGFHVYVLSVGWNEFRHFQNIWIPELLWGTINVMNYIQEN